MKLRFYKYEQALYYLLLFQITNSPPKVYIFYHHRYKQTKSLIHPTPSQLNQEQQEIISISVFLKLNNNIHKFTYNTSSKLTLLSPSKGSSHNSSISQTLIPQVQEDLLKVLQSAPIRISNVWDQHNNLIT